MAFTKVELTGSWDLKLPLWILLVYFFLVFPAIHFVFRNDPWIVNYGRQISLAAIIFYLIGVKKISFPEFGLAKNPLKQHLIIGAVTGFLILLSLPILDGLIVLTGLDQSELYAGAMKRASERGNEVLNPLSIVFIVITIPAIEQIFFTGFVSQSLLRKFNPILAVYIGGILFALGHFQFNLGVFAIGVITAYLFHVTGTLYASALFHMSCSLAGILLVNYYPRLITILGFLY